MNNKSKALFLILAIFSLLPIPTLALPSVVSSDKQQLIYRDLMDMKKKISIFIDLIVERLSSLENN